MNATRNKAIAWQGDGGKPTGVTLTSAPALRKPLLAESSIIGTLVWEWPETLPPFVGRLLRSAPESFDDPRYGALAVAIRDTAAAGEAVNFVTIKARLNGEFDPADLPGPESVLPIGLCDAEAQNVWEAFQLRKLKSVFGDAQVELEQHPAQAGAIIAGVRSGLDFLDEEAGPTDLLEKRRFNIQVTPPPCIPIYSLAGHVISTPGNLTSITSAAKTGKTAVIGAMIASTMTQSPEADLLGFKSSNSKGFALLHFDSEQSPQDFWHLNARLLHRAALPTPPPWYQSYCLTGLGCKVGWQCVLAGVKSAAEKFGGVHSILLDGVADFVEDVNDAGESNDFVAKLHGLAIEHDCSIVGVIHFNPGGEKTRGHLGSQLERKSEANLRLDKSGEVTSIWSDKQRRAPILKGTGPCFKWSNEVGMHVSVETLQAATNQIEVERLSMLADDVFLDRPSMRYSDLISTVKTALKVSDRTAERKVSHAVKLGVIKKSVAGLWTKAT